MNFITLHPAARLKLGTAAAVLAPIVLVLFTKLFGLGPGHVAGSQQGDTRAAGLDSAVVGTAQDLTRTLRCEATQEAAKAAEALRLEEFPERPFYLTGMFAGGDNDQVIPTPEMSPSTGRFTVSGFISGAQPMAVINGQVCTIGNTVTSDGYQWTVEAIDCDKQVITLKDGNGKRLVIEAEQAGANGSSIGTG